MRTVSHPKRAEVRLIHVELKRIAQAIGSAALENLEKWGSDADGRSVKAATERLLRLLSSAPGFSISSQQQRQIIYELAEIRNSEFFNKFLANMPSGKVGGPATLVGWLEIYGDRLISLSNDIAEEEIRIGEEEARKVAETEAALLRASVERLVTEQKLGPIQFDISNGFVRFVQPEADIESDDAANANRAKEALLAIAKVLVADLNSSNCDNRFVRDILQLTSDLESSENVILLGLSASVQQSVADKMQEELPSVVFGRLSVYLSGIQMYVSQFESWRKFNYNAIVANLPKSEAEVAQASGKALLDELTAAGEVVDPEIKNKLSDLVTAVEKGAGKNSQIAYSILTTVSNFIAAVFKGSSAAIGDILVAAKQGIAEGVKTGTSRGTNILILTGFGAAAVTLYGYISPNAAKALNAEWLPKAMEALQEALKVAGG